MLEFVAETARDVGPGRLPRRLSTSEKAVDRPSSTSTGISSGVRMLTERDAVSLIGRLEDEVKDADARARQRAP